MRFTFTADKELYNQLIKIQDSHKENGRDISLKDVVEEAVFFLHQINELLNSGYKLSLVDPKGKKHLISRRKKQDDTGKDEGSGPENPQG